MYNHIVKESMRGYTGYVCKAAVAAEQWSVQAVLTVPLIDRAGDLVRPEGLDFSAHAADPWVDLEHGRTAVERRPVGWARKSLARPGAPYAVEWADLDVPGVGRCRLPVGTTYFDRDDPLSRQVYELVRLDALPGVSLEFEPVEAVVISPRSPLEDRPAYEFRKARVLRWSHCAEPVNPAALTVTKSLPPGVEVIAKAVRDGRLAGEPLHPYLAAKFADFRQVRVMGVKAMPDDRQTIYDDAGDDLPINATTSDDAPANNGVSALYAHAQALLDAITQLEADLEHTDNPQLYRDAMSMMEQVRELAEKVKALADEHDDALERVRGGGGTNGDDGESGETDMSTDEEGVLKAVRPVYRAVLKRVRVKRYRLADILKGIERARNPLAAAEEVRQRDPDAYRRLIEPRIRQLRRLQALGRTPYEG